MGKGPSGHQRGYRGLTDVWLTLPEIVRALGPFDLDPCCPAEMPWETAASRFTPEDDGLSMPWPPGARVWLNPPYGPETGWWIRRLARHGDGMALIFARTETAMFHKYIWGAATAIFFLRGRIHFHHPVGRRADFNSGAPSVLVAYGEACAERLRGCGIDGAFVPLVWIQSRPDRMPLFEGEPAA